MYSGMVGVNGSCERGFALYNTVTLAEATAASACFHRRPAFCPSLQEKVTETGAETEDPLAITGPADEERLGPVLKRARYVFSVPGVAPGEACLTDLADCLPRQEAREVFCLAGLHDLMQHYRPLTAAASHSMFS